MGRRIGGNPIQDGGILCDLLTCRLVQKIVWIVGIVEIVFHDNRGRVGSSVVLVIIVKFPNGVSLAVLPGHGSSHCPLLLWMYLESLSGTLLEDTNGPAAGRVSSESSP